MLLPSRLTHTTLGDIFGALYRSKVSGVLELRELSALARCHQVVLQEGMIIRVISDLPAPVLGQILKLENAPESNQAGDPIYGSFLIALGIVDEQTIKAGLTKQTLLQLERLFELKDATLRFHVAFDGFESGVLREPLSIKDVLKGKPRARSDRSKAAERPRFEGPSEHSQPKRQRRPAIVSKKRQALQVLGLPAGATPAEIKHAFRSLASSNHPDRWGNAKTARRFAQLSEAYHFLTG